MKQDYTITCQCNTIIKVLKLRNGLVTRQTLHVKIKFHTFGHITPKFGNTNGMNDWVDENLTKDALIVNGYISYIKP